MSIHTFLCAALIALGSPSPAPGDCARAPVSGSPSVHIQLAQADIDAQMRLLERERRRLEMVRRQLDEMRQQQEVEIRRQQDIRRSGQRRYGGQGNGQRVQDLPPTNRESYRPETYRRDSYRRQTYQGQTYRRQ